MCIKRMKLRFATYFIVALLLFIGAGPAAAEGCCKADLSPGCCCSDSVEAGECPPQMCAVLEFQEPSPAIAPSFSELLLPTLQMAVDLGESPLEKPLSVVRPTVLCERGPPPLFKDQTLCYLPPPRLS